MAKRYGMVVDQNRCIGCQACVTACKTENNVPLGNWRTQVRYYEKGTYPTVKKFYLPILCDQCAKAPCVKASKKSGGGGIYDRGDGIIEVDKAKCKKDSSGVYEGAAIESCPIGMLSSDKNTGMPVKCNFCSHRVDAGLVPACVQTCMGRARVFGDLNDPNSEVSKIVATRGTRALRPEEDEDPGVLYAGIDMAQTHGSQKIKGFEAIDTKDMENGTYSQQ